MKLSEHFLFENVKNLFQKNKLNNSNQSIFTIVFYYSLLLLPVGLVFGEVPTSVSEIIVFTLWLLSKQYKNLSKLLYSKYFWITSALYLIHIIALIYSSDFHYAINDLRVKIPLLFFPLIFFTTHIPADFIIKFLKWFVMIVCINLIYLYLHNSLLNLKILDSRNASLFISHIRLGLISAFAIVTTAYLIINFLDNAHLKIIFLIIGLIILLMMFSLGLITGITTLFITTFVTIIFMILKKSNRLYIYLFSLLCLIFIVFIYFYVQSIYHKYFPNKNSSKIEMINADILPYTENGNLVFTQIADEQLRREWEKRSFISYDSKDKKNNDLKYTLYRYLASKGLTKDSAGLSKLTIEDIRNIENGNPNYLYVKAGFFEKRIYELIQEYQYFKVSGDPNGKTIILRLLYWKIAWHIWMKNFWIGVGTGDVQNTFDKEYTQYPQVNKCNQLRAHNQILTIAITFGIPGLLLILISIFYPLLDLKKSRHFLMYFMFSTISFLSFFIDDTFETQPGVTFYAMFNTLIIYFCQINSE